MAFQAREFAVRTSVFGGNLEFASTCTLRLNAMYRMRLSGSRSSSRLAAASSVDVLCVGTQPVVRNRWSGDDTSMQTAWSRPAGSIERIVRCGSR